VQFLRRIVEELTDYKISPCFVSPADATAVPGEIESLSAVMPRACRGHPRLSSGGSTSKMSMAGTSPAMTRERWFNHVVVVDLEAGRSGLFKLVWAVCSDVEHRAYRNGITLS
jgi:hypothetical protein